MFKNSKQILNLQKLKMGLDKKEINKMNDHYFNGINK